MGGKGNNGVTLITSLTNVRVERGVWGGTIEDIKEFNQSKSKMWTDSKWKKDLQNTFVKKATHKMLVKLTPCDVFWDVKTAHF